MLRIFTLLSILILSQGAVSAQNQPKIDSLNQVLETEITDSERVDTYNAIAYEYRNQDSAKTAIFVNKAIISFSTLPVYCIKFG